MAFISAMRNFQCNKQIKFSSKIPMEAVNSPFPNLP